MAVFYRKHLAKNYWPIFNQLVYFTIWLRALLFVIINLIKAQMKPPARQELKEIQIDKLC